MTESADSDAAYEVQILPSAIIPNAAAFAAAHHALDIDLGRRFGEWEVRRPGAHGEVFTLAEAVQEGDQDALQVSEADQLVDQEPLDLMKDRYVRQIRVSTIDAPGRDDLHRRLSVLHVADLHR